MNTLTIQHDNDLENPREHENLGTLACAHRRMTLGDVQIKSSPDEYEASLPSNSLIVPVYMYEHGGVALSTSPFSCPWDSGQVGIYHVSPARLIEEYGADNEETRAQAKSVIDIELSVYQSYLNGEGWLFEITDAQGNEVSSCGGFLGSDITSSGMMDYLLGEVDAEEVERAASAAGLSFDRSEWNKAVQASQSRRSPSP